jgi:NAD(P)-dependent dehydrogenase (short-subunit alcohol dehydrogenase family)
LYAQLLGTSTALLAAYALLTAGFFAGLAGAGREVEAAGGRALVLPCDVSDADAVEAAAARAEAELGPIDVWVNAAMVAVLAFVHETAPADIRKVTEVTYLGAVNGTLAALRRMRPRDRGVIVQVGSALAYRAIPLQASYCGAKFAIRGFTDALRTELLHERSGVRVTMVQLPGLNTPQFTWVRTTLRRHPRPVPPVFQPEVAANAIVQAAEHPRRELWVGANTALVIAGNKLAPRLADRYLARTNVKAQQTDQPIDPSRPDYLYEPLDDRGTHGPFDGEAKPRSLAFELARRRRTILWGVALAAALVSPAARRARGR